MIVSMWQTSSAPNGCTVRGRMVARSGQCAVMPIAFLALAACGNSADGTAQSNAQTLIDTGVVDARWRDNALFVTFDTLPSGNSQFLLEIDGVSAPLTASVEEAEQLHNGNSVVVYALDDPSVHIGLQSELSLQYIEQEGTRTVIPEVIKLASPWWFAWDESTVVVYFDFLPATLATLPLDDIGAELSVVDEAGNVYKVTDSDIGDYSLALSLGAVPLSQQILTVQTEGASVTADKIGIDWLALASVPNIHSRELSVVAASLQDGDDLTNPTAILSVQFDMPLAASEGMYFVFADDLGVTYTVDAQIGEKEWFVTATVPRELVLANQANNVQIMGYRNILQTASAASANPILSFAIPETNNDLSFFALTAPIVDQNALRDHQFTISFPKDAEGKLYGLLGEQNASFTQQQIIDSGALTVIASGTEQTTLAIQPLGSGDTLHWLIVDSRGRLSDITTTLGKHHQLDTVFFSTGDNLLGTFSTDALFDTWKYSSTSSPYSLSTHSTSSLLELYAAGTSTPLLVLQATDTQLAQASRTLASFVASTDMDGDGLDDLVLITSDSMIDQVWTPGRVGIIRGTTLAMAVEAASTSLYIDDLVDVWVSPSDSEFSRAGAGAFGLGDVNGDGFDDLALGLPLETNTNGLFAGSFRVVYGGEWVSGEAQDHQLHDLVGMTIQGSAGFESIGRVVRRLGDVNADGFDDFAYAAPDQDQGIVSNAGSVGIVWGAKHQLSDPALTLTNGADHIRLAGFVGSSPHARWGDILSIGSKINADAFDDFVFSDADGKLHVLFGGQDSQSLAPISLTLQSTHNAEQLTISDIRLPGDMTGDGLGDILAIVEGIGAYLIEGREAFDTSILTEQTAGVTFWAMQEKVVFVDNGSTLHDLNHDGFADAIIADENASLVRVVYGGKTADLTALSIDVDSDHSVLGGGLTDRFQLLALDFAYVEGGASQGGFGDILAIGVDGMELNLSNIGGRIDGIEVIDLRGYGSNKVVLSSMDIVAMSDYIAAGYVRLRVLADEQDTVQRIGAWEKLEAESTADKTVFVSDSSWVEIWG